jgi:hypothetical protein
MLLTATAAAALLGMTAPGALAFDKVNWEWDKHVKEWVNIDIDIKARFYPDGIVEVEKLQAHFGDVHAYATVNGVYNNLPVKEPPKWYDPKHPPIRVDGPSAKDLPKVLNAATAVGNNQSIDSTVPILLHDAQFLGGNLDGLDCSKAQNFAACAFLLTGAGIDADNTHTEIAGLLTAAALLGALEKADINATANVSNILNAYVENSATAVGNNASFTIEPTLDKYGKVISSDNNVLIADLTQWSYADVKAQAYVGNVVLEGYEDFGRACFGGGCDEVTPIVSNVATAVGNNLNISVGVDTD